MSQPAARKRLGQHFLHDPAVIRRIIQTIRPEAGDQMLEIGGGRGALTAPLLETVNRLQVIEKDRRLIESLRALAPAERLNVIEADALRLDYAQLATSAGSLRIVGNLPYNISTPLLFRFLESRQWIRDLHLMLQKEVADRMSASPGSKAYGRLTIMLSAWTDIEACFDIGPGAFAPPPKVRSTFLRIVPRETPKFELSDQSAFERLVALAFSMRRKTLRRILKGRVTENDLVSADFDPQARPEELAPADFARLSELTG
jgi:16S rRNA (adenine1518-N6/adenine1519-N6)-dimethyltransferase